MIPVSGASFSLPCENFSDHASDFKTEPLQQRLIDLIGSKKYTDLVIEALAKIKKLSDVSCSVEIFEKYETLVSRLVYFDTCYENRSRIIQGIAEIDPNKWDQFEQLIDRLSSSVSRSSTAKITLAFLKVDPDKWSQFFSLAYSFTNDDDKLDYWKVFIIEAIAEVDPDKWRYFQALINPDDPKIPLCDTREELEDLVAVINKCFFGPVVKLFTVKQNAPIDPFVNAILELAPEGSPDEVAVFSDIDGTVFDVHGESILHRTLPSAMNTLNERTQLFWVTARSDLFEGPTIQQLEQNGFPVSKEQMFMNLDANSRPNNPGKGSAIRAVLEEFPTIEHIAFQDDMPIQIGHVLCKAFREIINGELGSVIVCYREPVVLSRSASSSKVFRSISTLKPVESPIANSFVLDNTDQLA